MRAVEEEHADIDLLIESAVVEGELESGISPRLVAARSSLGSRGVSVLAGKSGGASLIAKSPPWSLAEDEFLKKNLGVLSEVAIAEALGRSDIGVHLRWSRDLKLPAPSKNPNVVTCNQIANGMGLDAKSVGDVLL